jgi:hypothetical protein
VLENINLVVGLRLHFDDVDGRFRHVLEAEFQEQRARLQAEWQKYTSGQIRFIRLSQQQDCHDCGDMC